MMIPDPEPVRAFLAEHHPGLAADAVRFAGETIAPLPPAADDDGARRQAREILGLLGDAGWCRWTVPAEWRGAPPAASDAPAADAPAAGTGIDLRACCLIREALAAASPLADAVFALQCLGSAPIALAGDDALRRRLLPEVAAGRAMAAFALTEPEAGSDPAAVATRARPDGDGYRLDGAKHLISNAGIADFYTLFATTDPEAGGRGLTAFVIPGDAAGLTFRPQVLSEPHPLGEILLEGVRVPASARLGAEGEGLKIALATLDRLRATVAAAACGMAARALAEALGHARTRKQFGRPLGEHQLVQAKLARMATELTAARLLTYRAAAAADGGAARVTLPAAMAKLYATEAAQRVVDDAVQLLGGRGVLAGAVTDRLYRAVRALRIYEGTSEIQHLVIARELLRDAAPEPPR
jgi:acyl-CoA dehydrogenase